MSVGNAAKSVSISRRLIAVGASALILVVALGPVLSGQATAKLVRDKGTETNAPRAVFGRIGVAWEVADVRTLADLVHEDGLRVTRATSNERVSNYSPSQAYYFFRNMFQSHRTLLFEFEMMQDASAGDRVHGMAVWKRRRPDSEHVEIVKLVCILVQQDEQWRLAEINTIR